MSKSGEMRNKKKIEEKENQIAGIFFAERGGVGLELDQWEERQKEQVFRPFCWKNVSKVDVVSSDGLFFLQND